MWGISCTRLVFESSGFLDVMYKCVRNRILLYMTPWGHIFFTALIISGVTFDGHFPLAFTSPSVLHPYVCVARTYIPGHTHLGVTQEVSLTL